MAKKHINFMVFIILGKIYKQVLDEGYKIKVRGLCDDGCELMTYKEKSYLFGLIKEKYDCTVYIMRRDLITDLRLVYK